MTAHTFPGTADVGKSRAQNVRGSLFSPWYFGEKNTPQMLTRKYNAFTHVIDCNIGIPTISYISYYLSVEREATEPARLVGTEENKVATLASLRWNVNLGHKMVERGPWPRDVTCHRLIFRGTRSVAVTIIRMQLVVSRCYYSAYKNSTQRSVHLASVVDQRNRMHHWTCDLCTNFIIVRKLFDFSSWR